MEVSIFNFVVVHNRKIPRGLTETHEPDLCGVIEKFVSFSDTEKSTDFK